MTSNAQIATNRLQLKVDVLDTTIDASISEYLITVFQQEHNNLYKNKGQNTIIWSWKDTRYSLFLYILHHLNADL
jgi:hypothetical protein